jgi:hypothetical protein
MVGVLMEPLLVRAEELLGAPLGRLSQLRICENRMHRA